MTGPQEPGVLQNFRHTTVSGGYAGLELVGPVEARDVDDLVDWFGFIVQTLRRRTPHPEHAPTETTDG